jgi:ABC-type sugar transport system ATPase subunit
MSAAVPAKHDYAVKMTGIGKALTEYTPDESKRVGIAMIFQEMSLVPTLDLTFPTRLTDHR